MVVLLAKVIVAIRADQRNYMCPVESPATPFTVLPREVILKREHDAAIAFGPASDVRGGRQRSYMEAVRKIGFTIASILAAISSAGMRFGV
jgi:hypothetical protein